MKKNEVAQELVFLISDNHYIEPPDEQFSSHCLAIRRTQAKKILDGLEEILGIEFPYDNEEL